MVNGYISKVVVAENEPAWAVNFKKSLVSLMKVQTPSGQYDLSKNLIRSGEVLPAFWKIMEQGVDGECENTYTVTELPEYMVSELPSELINAKQCQGKKVVQVIKTRDVNKCTERAVFQVNQPGRFDCATGNCDNMWTRSSMTRYIACGTSEQNMELQVILNEGELQQSLLAFNTENVVTGTKQVLKMERVKNSMSNIPQIQSPKTLENLYYEYPKTMSPHMKSTDPREAVLLKLEGSMLAKISPETLKQKIVQQLKQVAENLKEVEQIEKKTIASHVLSIQKVFSLLDTQQMKSLYEQVKGVQMNHEYREVMEQLVMEMAVMSGTNPAVMFVKELIESGEMSPLRAGLAITTLPHYINTPTIKLMDEMFELVQSSAVTKHTMLKHNAELAFASMVYRACIDQNRVNRFPVYIFGEFCNSQTSELTSKYIPYFANKLRSAQGSEERKHLMFVLGNFGHDAVISILLPYVEGRASGSTTLEQRIALYSLTNVARQHRDVLIPNFSAIAHNPSEHRTVRITALNLLMEMRPSMVYFQKLATSTWFEKDIEFQKYVYSTLKSLTQIRVTEQPTSYSTVSRNSMLAKSVIHLAKPVPTVISSTLNYFTSEWLAGIQAGYQGQMSYEMNPRVKSVYGRLEYFFEQLRFTPIEFSVFSQGTEQLVEKIRDVFGQDTESMLEKIHPQWRETISSLGMKSIEGIPFNAGVWAKFFDDVQVVQGINGQNLDSMLKSIKHYISEPQSLKQKVCGTTPFNFVKVNNIAPTELLIPSDMGFPILIEVQMPAVVSMKGEFKCDCSGSLPSITYEVEHKTSAALTGYTGTLCPFTNEVIAVGIEEQWTVNYPVKVSTKMEMGKLQVVYEPTKNTHSTNQGINVWAYSVKPFATIKPVVFFDATPLIAHENTKVIKSHAERTSKSFPALSVVAGIDLKYVVNTETDIRDMKTLIDTMALYKYNPVNTVLFSWTSTALRRNGMPSARFHEVKMVYNPNTSTTKQVEFDVSMALAYKTKDEGRLVNAAPLIGSIQQHQQLNQHIEEMDLEEAFGLRTDLDVKFNGGATKTFTYSATFGQGHSGNQQKWNLHLEDKNRMNICVDGKMNLPSVNLRETNRIRSQDVQFSYQNNIGFGHTCQENTVHVTGTASVSQEQKERFEDSKAAQECEKATRKIEGLKEDLKRAGDSSTEARHIEERLINEVEKRMDSCEHKIEQLSTIDQVKFVVKYSPMPEYAKRYTHLLDTTVKAVLLPYVVGFEKKNMEHEVDVELKFNPKRNTLNMVFTDAEGTTVYHNIRLPEGLKKIVPLVATETAGERIVYALQGSTGSKCRVGDGIVRSFDQVSYAYEMDDCFHVLSSDCGREHTHAVLAKQVGGKKEIEIFTLGSKMNVRPSSSYRDSRKEFEIEVDGRRIELNRDETKSVRSQDGESTYTMYRY